MTIMQTRARGLAQDHWRRIKNAPQRLVLCRLMLDIMRTLHSVYAPASERFGTRLETFFIGLCVALGDIEGKPLSIAKIEPVSINDAGQIVGHYEDSSGHVHGFVDTGGTYTTFDFPGSTDSY